MQSLEVIIQSTAATKKVLEPDGHQIERHLLENKHDVPEKFRSDAQNDRDTTLTALQPTAGVYFFKVVKLKHRSKKTEENRNRSCSCVLLREESNIPHDGTDVLSLHEEKSNRRR